MRIKILTFAAFFLLISNSSLGSPQTPTPSTSSSQAATLLAQSVSALTGSVVVNDVTLTGTVQWIAGSDNETGTCVYKSVSGTYRLDMTFRNGTRSEIVSPVNGTPSGNWIGLDGVSHPISNHNLMSDAGWFPAFTLGNLISASNTILTYVGQETRNGSSVIHISSAQIFSGTSGDSASLMQHLTQVDIYLDPTTFLPVSYVFNSHPDNNALLDISTEMRYSNYQSAGGRQISFHIQRYFNSTLAIDLQIQNASVNTGITSTQIAGQ